VIVSTSIDVMRRWSIVIVVGLAIGIATAIAQTHLDSPWSSLANAASPWLAGAFIVGTLWRRLPSAALAGLVACLLELVGYYATDTARGFSTSQHELVFWGAAALVGGPVVGVAGHLWWRRSDGRRALGAAVLAAAFLAEAAVGYGWRLHYLSSVILFACIGVAIVAVLGIRGHQHLRIAQALTVVLPVGILAEFILGTVARV
jgi:hypothetical protein